MGKCVSFKSGHFLLLQLQLYIQDSSSVEELVVLMQQVSLRRWHDVRVTGKGGNITLRLDGDLEHQGHVALPSPLRTTSPLYIGGLPSKLS